MVILVVPGSQLQIKLVVDLACIDRDSAARILAHTECLIEHFASGTELNFSQLETLIPAAEIPVVRGGAPADQSANFRSAPVLPRNNVELALVNIWKDVLELPSIGIRDSFFGLGGHSLLAVRLMSAIRQRFGKRLGLSVLFRADTIEKLAREIKQSNADEPWSPLVRIREGQGIPLFCIHPAGGNVLCYAELARALKTGQPVYGLQSQDLEGAIETESTIEAIAAAYLRAMRQVQPSGPYYLAGWSFGGLVAFEIARQLEEEGENVPVLALLDAFTPACLPLTSIGDPADVLIGLFGPELGLSPADISTLEPDAQLEIVLDRARKLGFVPAEVDLEQALRFLSIANRTRLAAGHYLPQTYSGDVHLFRCRDEIAPELLNCSDPVLGWAPLVKGSLEVHFISGHHQSLVQQPNVGEVAAILRAILENVNSTDQRL